MSQTQRVVLLDPSAQSGFDADADPFGLPSRNPAGPNTNLGLKSRSKPTTTTTTASTTTHNNENTTSRPDLNVSFNSASSQYQYNTYQHDDLYGGDSSPVHKSNTTTTNSGKANKKDQSPAEFAFKPQSKYDMKNHMANERTFFKYLFTGLHIGSIGTLVLTFFPNDDIHKLYLVIMIWLIAFGFMFWGLYGYYKRKHLMEIGKLNETSEISPHTPLLISSIFVGVILSVVWYGLFVHYKYENGISISKLLMMSEKETGGSRKKRGDGGRRHRRNGGGRKRQQRTAAATEDTTNESTSSSSGDKGTAATPKKSNDNGTPEAAGFYNNANGQIIEPAKFKPQDDDAQVDGKMDLIGFEKDGPKPVSKTESASVVPDFNEEPKARPKRLRKVIGEPLPKGIVAIPQTNTHGSELEVDVRDHGLDDDDDDDHDYDDDDSYNYEHHDADESEEEEEPTK